MSFPTVGRLLAACALAGATALAPLIAVAQTSPPTVALVMKSASNDFFVSMEKGAKAYQQQHAAQFSLLSQATSGETDVAGQVALVEQMIAAHPAAIVIAPADSKALVPVLQKAAAAGIKLVNIDNRLDPTTLASHQLQVPFVGPDNQAGAFMVGQYLAGQLHEGDEVGILEGVASTANAQQRTAGFKEAMEAAKVKVVALRNANWERAPGEQVAAAMLREHPQLKALLAGNDNMAIGAAKAVSAAGKRGQVKVVGYDNIAAIAPLLANGEVTASADQYGSRQAVYGIEAALKLVAGQDTGARDGVIVTPVDLVKGQP